MILSIVAKYTKRKDDYEKTNEEQVTETLSYPCRHRDCTRNTGYKEWPQATRARTVPHALRRIA